MEKPVIVISAIRFFQGGTIVIVNECLQFLASRYADTYCIKALVYNKSIYASIEGIEWIEFPKARNSSLRRLYYEYVCFNKCSLSWKPELWLSLQDSTPRVRAKVRAVYFHNPLLLKPNDLNLWKAQPRLGLLKLLYKHIYVRGIEENKFVFTQQEHIANFLAANYCKDRSRIVVFPPKLNLDNLALPSKSKVQKEDIYTFIFPATAFYYKNYGLLLTACRQLQKLGKAFRVWLTIDGSENRFTRNMVRQAKKDLPEVEFLGFQKRSELFKFYEKAHCMIFPSLLESWGLPLSEFSKFEKPILCADLPYGKESLAGYDKVCFFDPYKATTLALLMQQAIEGTLKYPTHFFERKWPVISSWAHCFELLLKKP